eukprot:1281290-Amphidinium_carterae.1
MLDTTSFAPGEPASKDDCPKKDKNGKGGWLQSSGESASFMASKCPETTWETPALLASLPEIA